MMFSGILISNIYCQLVYFMRSLLIGGFRLVVIVVVVFYRLIVCVWCVVLKFLMISVSEVGMSIVVLMFCSIWNVINCLILLVMVYSLDVMVNISILDRNVCLWFSKLVNLLVVIMKVVKMMLQLFRIQDRFLMLQDGKECWIFGNVMLMIVELRNVRKVLNFVISRIDVDEGW